MDWILVGQEAIDSWREREPDAEVWLNWLTGFYRGPDSLTAYRR